MISFNEKEVNSLIYELEKIQKGTINEMQLQLTIDFLKFKKENNVKVHEKLDAMCEEFANKFSCSNYEHNNPTKTDAKAFAFDILLTGGNQ